MHFNKKNGEAKLVLWSQKRIKIHDCSLFWLGAGTSIISCGLN
jgi:hypothetical protein